MAITQAVCDSFKKELLEGEHDFRSSGGDQFKLALYGSSASLSNTTTAYTTSQEVSASGTYSAGGGNLTSTGAAATNNTSFIDFSDISFTSASISAQAAVIYNSNTSATTNTITYTISGIRRDGSGLCYWSHQNGLSDESESNLVLMEVSA